MDGNTAIAPADKGTELERETRALAAALLAREAQDRAEHQAARAAAAAAWAHLGDHQQRFQLWAGGPLNTAVRRADLLLKPARCALTLALGRWSRFGGPPPPTHILTESLVTLTRDGSSQTHGLTVGVQADGTVRARRDSGRGAPRGPCFAAPVSALTAAMADGLITAFITECLAPERAPRPMADRQVLHRMFR